MFMGPLEKIARVMLLPGVRIVEIVPCGKVLVIGPLLPVLVIVGSSRLGMGPAKVLLSWTGVAHTRECDRTRKPRTTAELRCII